MQPHDLDAAQVVQSLDQSRNLSLARYVSLGFAAAYALALLAIGAWSLIAHRFPHPPLMLTCGALAVDVCLQLIGYGLARGGHGDGAARVIILGILFSQASFHLLWASLHGFDAILIASYAASVMPIGLGSVLSGTRLMLMAMLFTGGLATFELLAYPHLLGFAAAPFEIGVSLAIVLVVDGLIALLVYGASALYSQAVQRMDILRVAYAQAVRLDALKDQFITHINHELRTPIMTLQGTLEFLSAALDQLPPLARDTLLEQARQNAERLVTLLSGVLEVRNIDRAAGAVVLEEVAVAPVLAATLQLTDPFGERRIQLHLPEHLVVWGQATGLQQILTNYVSNALKYSPSATPIVVDAVVLPARRGGQPLVEIAVSDGGPGIPADQIPLLFHRFTRLERDLASAVPGSGLGLYLCKAVAEMMGGEVGVTSPGYLEAGSTFWVRLPGGIAADTAPRPLRRRTTRSLGQST